MKKVKENETSHQSRQTFIYGLRPRGGDFFYIGSTIQPLKSRLAGHLNQSHNKAVISRIKEIGRDNVEIVLIEVVESAGRVQREYEVITQHQAAGIELLNTQVRIKANTRSSECAVSPTLKPWDPQAEESRQAYEAFVCYRDLGSERSLEAVGRRLEKSWKLCGRWSSRWKWLDRVAAYDAHMADIEQKAREKALTKKAEDWASKELEMARLLYDKAKAMLAFPLAKQVTKDGQTVVMPADWRMRDAAAIAEAGVKMERLARGESTDRITVSVAAREAFQSILAETGLSEEKARQIVASRFGISEQELISVEVM